MKNLTGDMFGDRRLDSDRRCQDLPMPAGLDRRTGMRREKGFQNKPWWLNVDYAEELVSLKASEVLTRENIRVRSNHKKTSND
ncbi:hypothetical protein NO559_09565 [Dasania sp. GY-MA-18]|uniref:Uncharacterized protein n=1 Tax=Dasania phycosphaerae TaxID=2950436 RepID=A0A9J6RLX0_9GAMM|nr:MULTISPECIES: hypothetical protein [Dasania]MCR8923021.1 hypothetical protein [Dasania sp. GY-MA-18]MCZ0865452.1 hypothetical protein [Dasania phycosphaerae]MCZ0869177.1 hypothetical protein [Dasania phycosphaerae]